MTETPVQEWEFNPAEILASTRKVQGIFHQPVVDKDGELITPKGMREAVPDFMHLPALHDFHKERPVGLATKVKELSGGRFWFEGVIKSTPDCDDIWEKVKTGNYDQVSIFGKRTKYNNQCSLPQNMRSGTCITDGVRLDSISVCDENARNPQTSLEVKKARVVFDSDTIGKQWGRNEEGTFVEITKARNPDPKVREQEDKETQDDKNKAFDKFEETHPGKASLYRFSEAKKAETTDGNLQHSSTDYAEEEDFDKGEKEDAAKYVADKKNERKRGSASEQMDKRVLKVRGVQGLAEMTKDNMRKGGKVRISQCPRCQEDPNTISKDNVEKGTPERPPDQPYKFHDREPQEVWEKRPGDKKEQIYKERGYPPFDPKTNKYGASDGNMSNAAAKHNKGSKVFREPMTTVSGVAPKREELPQRTPARKQKEQSGTAKRTAPLAMRSRKEPMDTVSTHFEAKKDKPSPDKNEAPTESRRGSPEDRGHISGNRYSYKVREAEPRHKGTAPKDNPPKGHTHTGDEEDLPYKTVDGKRQSTTVQGHKGRYDQGSERSATTHKVYSHPGTNLGGNEVTPPNEETRSNVKQTHGKKLETRSGKLARYYPDKPQASSPHETKQMKQEKTKDEQLKENRNRQKRDNRALAKQETKKAGDEMDEVEKGVRPKITEEPIEGKGSTTQKVRKDVRERGEIRSPDMKKGAAEDLEDEEYDEDEDKDFKHAKPTDKEGQWSKNKDPNGSVKMSKAQEKGKPEPEDEEEEEEEYDEDEEEVKDEEKKASRTVRPATKDVSKKETKTNSSKQRDEGMFEYNRSTLRHRATMERQGEKSFKDRADKRNASALEAERSGASQRDVSRKLNGHGIVKKGDEDAASESFNPSTVTKGEQMDETENDVEYVTKALVPIEEIDTIVKARTEEISKAYVAQLDEIKKAYDTKFVELSSKIEKMENETIRKGGSVVVIPELLSGTDGSSSNADALARMQAGR